MNNNSVRKWKEKRLRVKTRIYEAGAGVKSEGSAGWCDGVPIGEARRVLASMVLRTVWHGDRC
jgi:hypothetical protein